MDVKENEPKNEEQHKMKNGNFSLVSQLMWRSRIGSGYPGFEEEMSGEESEPAGGMPGFIGVPLSVKNG